MSIKLIGLAFIAFGQVLANGGEGESAAPESAAPGGDAPKRRGRPPGSGAGASDEPKAKTLEELRAITGPLIEGGQGAEVKKIIGKYSPTGIKDLKAEDQPAFLKDLEALNY